MVAAGGVSAHPGVRSLVYWQASEGELVSADGADKAFVVPASKRGADC